MSRASRIRALRFAQGLARWRWRLVGLMLLVLAYALVWILNLHTQHQPMTGLLVVVPVLLILIAGGNLLQGWLGIRHRAPQFAEPDEPEGAGRSGT